MVFMAIGVTMAVQFVWEHSPAEFRNWWKRLKTEFYRGDSDGVLDELFPVAALMAFGATFLFLFGLIWDAEMKDRKLKNESIAPIATSVEAQ